MHWLQDLTTEGVEPNPGPIGWGNIVDLMVKAFGQPLNSVQQAQLEAYHLAIAKRVGKELLFIEVQDVLTFMRIPNIIQDNKLEPGFANFVVDAAQALIGTSPTAPGVYFSSRALTTLLDHRTSYLLFHNRSTQIDCCISF